MTDQPAAGIAATPLIEQVTAAIVAAHATNVATSHASLHELVNAVLEEHEQELASMVRAHLAPIMANVPHTATVTELFAALSAPEHQTQFFTALFALKGIIDGFVSAALAPYVEETAQTAWAHKPVVALSPDQVGLAVLRGNIGMDYAISESLLSGLDPDRLQVVIDNTGEPPGIEQMLELFRRGEITEDELVRAIRQSRVRDEWVPAVLKMRYVVPSPAEVIAGYVEGHLDEATAREKFGEAGGRPDNFAWQYETAGRPPSAGEMLHLLNRRLVDVATVEQAIRESDIKDKYIPQILELRRYVPPPRSIVAMIRQGAITDDLAREYLADAGVTDADIALFIKSGHSTRASTQKELSVNAIVHAYTEHVLSRDDAHAQIVAAGYSPQAADVTLEAADATLTHKYQAALVTHVHNLYVKNRLHWADAQNVLGEVGLQQAQIAQLQKLWNLEQDENQRLLSKAEVLGAWRRKVRDRAWAEARLLLLGYAPADLDVLLAEAYPPPKA